MSHNSGIPWKLINDYLVEVCSAIDMRSFCDTALLRLQDLVGFDVNGVAALIGENGEIGIHGLVNESRKLRDLFDSHFLQVMPQKVSGDQRIGVIDWHDLAGTEYYSDFIKPQGIAYSAALLQLGGNSYPQGGLALHRSRNGPCFDGRDAAVLNIIQPHLSNFFTMLSMAAKPDPQGAMVAAAASDHRGFTKREAEVAALICGRIPTVAIASKLFISPRTVHKHVENIFAKMQVTSREELIAKLLVWAGCSRDRDLTG